MSDNLPTPETVDNTFDTIINSALSKKDGKADKTSLSEAPFWIKHGGFLIVKNIWHFFIGPSKVKIPKQKDSRFKFVAEQLISTLPDNANPIITATSEKLLSQHRTIENTEARRRLEKWACWTIIIYLVSVFALVILNGLSRVIWPDIFTEAGFISDTVMYVILSTTTVNIIGLGIIVLKGHFPKEEKEAQEGLEKSIEEATEKTDIQSDR